MKAYMFSFHRNAFLFITALIGAQLPAHADPISDAQRVIQHRLSMPTPTTVFARWQADQWSFAAVQCGQAAGLKNELVAVAKLPLYFSGSNRSPSNITEYCSTLAAAGPDAECFNLAATQPPFTMPTAGLPSNYLYLRNLAHAKEGSQHMVGGYCNLVKNMYETRQFFAGNGTLKWLSQPRSQTFQTAKGPQTLNTGTVSFTVDGMPGAVMPKTVVLAQ